MRQLILWGVLLGASLAPASAQAYTPKSPEVQAMLDKATAYLETHNYGAVGGDALIALALLKAEKENSPKIAATAAACARHADELGRAGKFTESYHYGTAIACIYLSDLDSDRYRPQIEKIVSLFLRSQQPNGCWGYIPHTYDDTSQTQYGVLCLWAAHNAKIAIPPEAVENVMMWFVRVQDVSGGWTYQAKDPGSAQRIAQGAVTHSMSAAGAGSLYICADLLGFRAAPSNPSAKDNGGIPGALKKVETKEEKSQRVVPLKPSRTNASMLTGTLGGANAWFARNLTYERVDHWTHYYMYGVERYKSFQEFVEGGKSVDEPDWYNKGVDFLRKTQKADGSWHTPDSHAGNDAIDTAFAVLFLTRSTKKAIQKTETGRLRGNKGLPDDVTDVRFDAEGKVKNEQETPPVEQLLSLLEDPNNPQGDFVNNMPNELELSTDPKVRNSQIERLRRMVISGSFQARLTAVKTLGRQRDLANAPALIFALSDPDYRVVKAAQNGLCFISRRIDANELPEFPTRAQWTAAQEKWKQWYLSVRPDGELIE